MAHAFNWKPAMEPLGGEDPRREMEVYSFSGDQVGHLDDFNLGQIVEGDQFWDTESRRLAEVTDVRTKIYKGVVGYEGEEGNDNVFFEFDYYRPTPPHVETHWSDRVHFLSIEEFAERVASGDWIPHAGNGLPPLLP